MLLTFSGLFLRITYLYGTAHRNNSNPEKSTKKNEANLKMGALTLASKNYAFL